jgi:hypothetical protein
MTIFALAYTEIEARAAKRSSTRTPGGLERVKAADPDMRPRPATARKTAPRYRCPAPAVPAVLTVIEPPVG